MRHPYGGNILKSNPMFCVFIRVTWNSGFHTRNYQGRRFGSVATGNEARCSTRIAPRSRGKRQVGSDCAVRCDPKSDIGASVANLSAADLTYRKSPIYWDQSGGTKRIPLPRKHWRVVCLEQPGSTGTHG